MELDAQRQLFEEQLAKEQERASQMVRAEVDTRRCRAEMEDSTFQNLIQTDADISQKNKKMLEESLAEVGQMEVDADWQAEVNMRQEKAEERQEKQRERLVNLSKQTRAREEEVVQLMLEVEGKQLRINMLKIIRRKRDSDLPACLEACCMRPRVRPPTFLHQSVRRFL